MAGQNNLLRADSFWILARAEIFALAGGNLGNEKIGYQGMSIDLQLVVLLCAILNCTRIKDSWFFPIFESSYIGHMAMDM